MTGVIELCVVLAIIGRSGRLAVTLGGGLARLVVVGLFAWWLVAALYGDRVTVAALTLAIVLVDISSK